MDKFLFLNFFYHVNNKRNMDPFLREFVGNKTLFYGFLSLIKVPFAAVPPPPPPPPPYQLPIQEERLAQMLNSGTLKRDIRRQRRPDHPPVPDDNNTQPYTVTSTGGRFLFTTTKGKAG